MQYPADNQIDVGANDMSQRVQSTAANCPDTRIVLGGYSLGAAVTDVVLALPFAVLRLQATPCPPDAISTSPQSRCSATAARGPGPSATSTRSTANGPSSCATATTRSAIRPTRTRGRTTGPTTLAPAYIDAGMVNQAADFVAGRV